MQKLDDVIVTFLPEAWSATRLVRAVGRRGNLVTSIVIVGWCGPREVRLVRGRDGERLGRRLAPVVDLVTSASSSAAPGPGTSGPPLTMINLPDGHRLFDESATGRKIVVAELAPAPEAVQSWLRVLAATAERVVGDARHDGRCRTLRGDVGAVLAAASARSGRAAVRCGGS